MKATKRATTALVLVSILAAITATSGLAQTLEQELGNGGPNGCGRAAVVASACNSGA